MKSISILFLLLIYSSNLFSQSETNRLIKKGLECCYNFKWKEASDIFQKIINKYPDDPNGYHYQSGIYLWYFLSNKEENDLQNFVQLSDITIEKAETKLEENPNDENTLYILGTNYTYRAIAFTKKENYLDAAWATKKSESYLSDVIKINPKNYDAYLGLGLYNFAIGQIPSAFKWALNLAGINGDKETGIRYIKLAASDGIISKVEAQYYLSQILSEVLFEYDSSAYYQKLLVRKYPSNLLFSYSYAVLEIKQKNLGPAEKILRRIINNNLAAKEKFLQLISLSNFLMADILFRENNFDSAKVYYQNFLNTTLDNDYTGIASYRLAVCFEITGDRENAQKYFKQSNHGNMDLDDDIFAKRKGEIYSKRTLSENEIIILKASNSIEAGKYQEAYDSLSQIIDIIKTDYLKAEAYLYLSEAAYGLSVYDSSLSYALISKNLNGSEENWIKPFSAYYAARAYLKMGNISASKSLLEEAEDFNEYDYQNKLKNLLYSISRLNGNDGILE